MSTTKSMTDVAYEIMSSKKRAIAFNKLWQDVSKITKLPNDLIAQFYSDLTLDGRFVSLKDNKWDLRNRRKFEESQFDISQIEIDDEDDEKEIFDEDGNVINTDVESDY